MPFTTLVDSTNQLLSNFNQINPIHRVTTESFSKVFGSDSASMAGAFVQAMDCLDNLTLNEKGSAAYKSSLDPLLDIFVKGIGARGTAPKPETESKDDIEAKINAAASAVSVKKASKYTPGTSREDWCKMIDEVVKTNKTMDLFVLIAHIRDVRGGKGERQLTYWALVHLYTPSHSKYVKAFLSLLGTYGCWTDMKALWILAENNNNEIMMSDITATLYHRLMVDLRFLQASKPDVLTGLNVPKELAAIKLEAGDVLSLAFKWMPTESCPSSSLYRALAKKMFRSSESSSRLKDLRKIRSAVNKHLDTVEVKMCANQFSKILPGSVPSGALHRYEHALLNEKADMTVRHADRPDRADCAANFMKHATSGGSFHGSSLEGHLLVEKVHKLNVDRFIPEGQFADHVRSVEKAFKDAGKLPEGSIDLRNSVALVDVSSSMNGIPMNVAVFMGLLISRLNNTAFKNRCITFHDDPSWVIFKDGMSFRESVKHLMAAPWGGSTNFSAAMNLILEIATQNKIEQKDMPETLFVLSDMQFDTANSAHYKSASTWEMQTEILERSFAAAGYKMPLIVFWNLRGDVTNVVATKDQKNAICLAGYSSALMKTLIAAGDIFNVKERGAPPTPMDLLISVLQNKRYELVRNTLGGLIDDTDNSVSIQSAAAASGSSGSSASTTDEDFHMI
jgi:Mg-chelatase subunit ChlD